MFHPSLNQACHAAVEGAESNLSNAMQYLHVHYKAVHVSVKRGNVHPLEGEIAVRVRWSYQAVLTNSQKSVACHLHVNGVAVANKGQAVFRFKAADLKFVLVRTSRENNKL